MTGNREYETMQLTKRFVEWTKQDGLETCQNNHYNHYPFCSVCPQMLSCKEASESEWIPPNNPAVFTEKQIEVLTKLIETIIKVELRENIMDLLKGVDNGAVK